MDKILLMGDNGCYAFARKTQNGLNLEPDLNSGIDAKKIVPYGFLFKFSGNCEIDGGVDFGIRGYIHQCYRDYEEATGVHLAKEEDFGVRNLQMTIEGLEKMVEEKGADFVLVDELYSEDMSTYWDISGRAQLLLYKK